MPEPSWKKFERKVARAFGTERFPANTGRRADFGFGTNHVVGQAKEVRELSLNQLTMLAEEMAAAGDRSHRLGVVCVKVRRGAGRPSAPLVVMTMQMFEAYFSMRSRKREGDG